MSWYCLTSGDEAFCNKDFSATLEMTMRAKRYQNSAVLLMSSMCCPTISHFSFS